MGKYEDAAREMDELKDTGREMEGLTPVRARVKPNAEMIYSVRFTSDEMKLLRETARGRGVKLSELIRTASLKETIDGAVLAPVVEVAEALRRRFEEATAQTIAMYDKSVVETALPKRRKVSASGSSRKRAAS